MLDSFIDDRVILEADYIIKQGATVRECGQRFGISKSTVHSDMRHRLKDYDTYRYNLVCTILEHNYNVRHLRGGESTRIKYCKLRNKQSFEVEHGSEQ